jgi:hypothetical protein
VTTFEKCQRIQRVIVNRAAEVMSYKRWGDDFAAKQIREIPEFLIKRNPELGQIQPAELTSDECDRLGFCRWSEENPMRLIPLWLLPFLAEEVKTTCIDGSSVLLKSEMDDDNRGGCLAYGITPKN